MQFEMPPALVTLDAARIRRSSADSTHGIGLRRERSVIWSAAVGFQLRIGENDRVRLTAMVGAEKRRPVIAIADGQPIGTARTAAGLGWQRGEGVRLEGGWFAIEPLHALAPLARAVALAGGSTIVERGYQASASIPLIALADHGARMGLRLATASVGPGDRLALGTAEGQDRRATVFLGLRFR